ncbi:MAG: hypothetical protein DMG05_27565 [Acidobacteria bacterium]|nr:MAG: hypothetical protein DMG05_27565 [Acidobacteriota bacterium]
MRSLSGDPGGRVIWEGEAPAEPEIGGGRGSRRAAIQGGRGSRRAVNREAEAPAEPASSGCKVVVMAKQSESRHEKDRASKTAALGKRGSAGASPSPSSLAPDQLPFRKYPTHGVKISSEGPTIVFLTACAKNRVAWLATDEVHLLLRQVWTEATAWLVGHYVIMPDHIHLFAAPGHPFVSFDNWVQYWKSQFSKRSPPAPAHRWETDHWDTRLRNAESYRTKWEYVRNNPVRHGLVERAEDWPYQGSIYDLPW